MPTLAALLIGDELLDGRVSDTNAAFLGGFLADRGHSLSRIDVVPDDLDAICRAIDAVDVELLVVSGGLGPTADDLTRQAAARWAGAELRENPEVLETLRRRFEARGYTFTENNRRQASFPGGAEILPTEVGSAPGFRLDHDGKVAFFFPGVPREFQWFVRTYLPDRIGRKADRVRNRLFFHGIGESALETRLDGIQDRAEASGARIGYRADYPTIEVKIDAPDTDSLDALTRFVRDRLERWLVGENDESLMARVGRLLLHQGQTVTTAESCTGGGIAQALTDIPGSSSWFERAIVTYSNDAKIEELGVDPAMLRRFGAVSAQTACQMAVGARRRADADFALAVSGIAGPSGGSPDKPVGTVYLALAAPDGTYWQLVHFRVGSREFIRRGTVYAALALLLWHLSGCIDGADRDVFGPFDDDLVLGPDGVPDPSI